MSIRSFRAGAAVAGIWVGLLPPAQAQSFLPESDRLHANAVASFQLGRFPEAYGRFAALADAGHTPSAELALFMYRRANTLFGRDWDVTQEQLNAWATLAGQPAPVLEARVQRRTLPPVARTSR
jgi:hypothetical protein